MSCCRVAKPSSLPKNWPHPTKADLVARPRRHINIGYEQEYSFINNSIKTSRYEAWNFLAYFLFEEFNPNEKPTNLYFLVIGCLQIVPAITNTDGYPTVFIPLFVVLLLFGLLKALEDYERHIADKKANSLPTSRYNYATKEFEGINWADLEVGDLVMVQSRQGIPADIALIQTAEENPANPKGICFIETKSLDGETNLKSRNVIAGLLGKVI